jgi:hypothetical protein
MAKTYIWRSPERLGQATAWLMVVVIGVEVVDAIASLILATGLAHLGQRAGPVQWLIVATSSLRTLLQLGVILIAVWLWRTCENAHVFRPTLRTSPLGAIGWYVVPLASLWMPLEAMSNIWSASEPTRSDSARGLLGAWWVVYLVSGVANFAFLVMESGDRAHFFAYNAGTDGAAICVAAIFGVLVRRLTANQVLKHSVVAFDEPAGAPGFVAGGLERYLR